MKRIAMTALALAALACGSDAAELLGVPGAGAQDGGVYEYVCPESNWLKTDIDQRPLGEITVYSSSTAFVDAVGGSVDWQQHAWSSVNGKVVVSCEAGQPVTIEVR